MNLFTDPLLKLDEYNMLLSSVRENNAAISVVGPSDSQKVHLAYSLCTHTEARGLFVTFNEMQARRAFEDFSQFLGDQVVYLPPKEIMLYNIEARSNDIIYQRVKTLLRCIQRDYKILIIPAESLVQMISPIDIFRSGIIRFQTGMQINLEELVSKLILYGYERVEMVEGKGQFAVRGGIIDIFAINHEQPIRIELFDIEVDSIRFFDKDTQRSTQSLDVCIIAPARDVVYSEDLKEGIISEIKKDLSEYIKKISKKANSEICKNLNERVNEDIERLIEHHYFAGIDRYLPYILKSPASIMDFIDSDSIVFLDETNRITQRIENIELEQTELAKNMMEKGGMLPRGAEWTHETERVIDNITKFRVVTMAAISSSNSLIRPSRQISIPSKSGNSYQNHIELMIKDIEHLKEQNCKVIVLSGPSGRGHRLLETFATSGITASYAENYDRSIQDKEVIVTHGSLQKGFEYPTIGFVVISDQEVFGQDKRIKKAKAKHAGNKIKAFSDLNVGDFVVHQAHGIGQYTGIEKLVVGEIKRDYLKIKYQDNAYLYIPTNQLDQIPYLF